MRPSWIISLLVLVVSEFAVAGPTVTSASGVSGVNLNGAVTIMGGLAGDQNGCTPPDTYSTCNTCNTAGLATCAKSPLCPCNQVRIYDGLILTIYFSNQSKDANGNTTTTSGNIIVTQQSTTTPLNILTNPNNGGTSAQISWSNICAQVQSGGGTDCQTLAQTIPNASVTLNFYQDTNNDGQVSSGETATAITFRILYPGTDTYATFTAASSDGIGAFEPYPGDGKIYIKDPQTSTTFPTLGYGGSVKNVRVFTATTSLTDANPLSSSSKDLAVSDDGNSLSKNIVDGLSNGTLYFVRLGMVDEAGNLTQLSPDPADTDAADPSCTTSPSSSCKYSATPDEVLGLLSDDFNCFVATAAYGSMLEPKLATFREFRTRFLLRNRWGRAFNSWYYAYGPYAARFIGERPWARALTRGVLWPAYGFSWVAVHFGVRVALTGLALVLATLFGLAHLAWPRREPRP